LAKHDRAIHNAKEEPTKLRAAILSNPNWAFQKDLAEPNSYVKSEKVSSCFYFGIPTIDESTGEEELPLSASNLHTNPDSCEK
jgi:hypothetical protein